MLSLVKRGIKPVLHAAGIEAHRFHPDTSQLARLMVALRRFNIDLVIDIGASEGQFAKEFRAGVYSGRLVSFEPQTAAHRRLLQESNRDPAWHVHTRCARIDRKGKVEVNFADNPVVAQCYP